jgi:glycerophosphoryl diester phosphodiesterase
VKIDAGPVLDPSKFDCTAMGIPDRASPIPVACAFDPTCRTPQISAHRGAGGQLGIIAPEDTLAAYRAGIALGVEFVETDPRPTSDGVLVNIHDATVDRTTDGTGQVDQMTFAQIEALHVKTDGLIGDFSCEKIPTLTQLLQTCVGRVVVLVDANKTDRVDLLVQAIHDANAVDWAIFDTSDTTKIDAALAMEPNLHFQIRPATVDEITTQMDHFAPRLPAIVELDTAERAAGSVVVHMRGTRSFTDVFPEDLAAIAQGDLTPYGTVLDEGVDILESDRPDLVIAEYKLRGLR